MKIVLERCDAKELYSYLVYLFENRNDKKNIGKKRINKLEQFKHTDIESHTFFESTFSKYNTFEDTEAINNAITCDDLGSRIFYTFKNSIKQNRSTEISKRELAIYFKFLDSDKGEYIPKENVEDLHSLINLKHAISQKINSSEKAHLFSKTKWWIYFWDKYNKKPGITRALLLLDPFGKATIHNLSHGNIVPHKYFGSYEFIGENFLSIKCNYTKNVSTNLSLKIFIGNRDKHSFFLGTYTTTRGGIFCGLAAFKKDNTKSSNDELVDKVVFVREKELLKEADCVEKLGISHTLVKFFLKRHLNIINVPDLVISENDINSAVVKMIQNEVDKDT